MRGWSPNESGICECEERDEDSNERKRATGAIDEGGKDRGREEADEDEEATGDSGFGLAAAVGSEDLGEEGGERVEEADVDGEEESEDPEVGIAGEAVKLSAEGELLLCV